VEKTVLVKEHRKAEENLEQLREIVQSISTADSQQIADAEQGNR
jgi:hypothetical protein